MALQALLVLEDGFTMKGDCFSGQGEVFGEVVFNTAMTGYQEMITDPSYRGQILTFTYPVIGSYGITEYDMESDSPQVEGLLVKECCRRPRNQRAQDSLSNYLEEHGIMGLEGIDTRSLTLHLRRAGTMKGVLSTEEQDPEALRQKLLAHPGIEARDLVAEVSNPEPFSWAYPEKGYHVVVYDYGVKYNILRHLTLRGCRVTVVPFRTPAVEVAALKPDGIVLSNGPGDPAAQKPLTREIQALFGKAPIMGICLGHQLLGMASGLKTYKLTFGHRGGNHPVKDLKSGKVLITSQNHGYCVDMDQMPAGTVVTHINLNDNTLEGMENREQKWFSVQYHPEASPGPHDSTYLFDKFMELMAAERGKGEG